MLAIIGAFGRLTAAGMDEDDAMEIVVRIMREGNPDGFAMITPLDRGSDPMQPPTKNRRTAPPR